MKEKPASERHRTLEQIREHYEIEKELAAKLRNASRQERRCLYSSLYEELYLRVPDHPQLTRKMSPQETKATVAAQINCIKPLLNKTIIFLEVGPGDCALSTEVAKFVKQVYAVDVSNEITKSLVRPPNFKLILSDGTSIPVPHNSVDIAYSNQLMEHLHPDDAFEQLRNIYNALTYGGVYICLTPNRLNGPHDVSKYFDQAAMGFHLKEYTNCELRDLFRKVGFSHARVQIEVKRKCFRIPVSLVVSLERLLMYLPHSLRNSVARSALLKVLLRTRFVGIK